MGLNPFACRSQVRQPVRLFETAMRQVAAPSQPNKPSVFDRLTTQAAKGNSAAAVTASAVVRQLRQSAAAAAATEGDAQLCHLDVAVADELRKDRSSQSVYLGDDL